MIRIESVNGKNVWELLKLQVSEDQRDFVASNDISIIEAYAAITANGYAFPFGIYDEDTPVGFLMIGFDVDDYWDDAPEVHFRCAEIGVWYLRCTWAERDSEFIK